MKDNFWMWFCLINMGILTCYILIMFCIQQKSLRDIDSRLERIERMIKEDITAALIADQVNVLSHCIDYGLTADTEGK